MSWSFADVSRDGTNLEGSTNFLGPSIPNVSMADNVSHEVLQRIKNDGSFDELRKKLIDLLRQDVRLGVHCLLALV